MRVGFMQFSPVLGDVESTIQIISRLMQQANEVDILVLPELCNSGYNFMSKEQAWETSEQVHDSEFIRYLESTCSKNNLHIVSGFNEREKDVLYNSAVLIGPGGYLGRYRKLHLFDNEKDFFLPGNGGLPVFDIGTCRLGMLVCFDWYFPEIWRILALKGADVICHPSNLVLPGLAQKGVPVHALINRVYSITANRIGTEGDLTFTGLSTIADPKGNVIAQASESHEEVMMVDIDVSLARDKKITSRNDVLKDRRPEEYSLLTEKISF